MTWKVVTEKTNKILCQSFIRFALDPFQWNLSLYPLKTTDFKLSKQSNDSNASDADSSFNTLAVYLRDHGENDTTSAKIGDKYKSVITDKNREPKKDSEGKPMHRLGPHLEELPGRNMRILHPDMGLPSHIIIRKLIDDYEKGVEENQVWQAHFEVKYSRDEKEDIMSYNDIIDYLSRDSALYD